MAYSNVQRAPFRLTWRLVLYVLLAVAVLTSISALSLYLVNARGVWRRNDEAWSTDHVAASYDALNAAIFMHIHKAGQSPATGADLVAAGVLEQPERLHYLNQALVNPFSGGPVRFVEAGDPHSAGDCLYLPAYCYRTVDHVKQAPAYTDYYLLVFGDETNGKVSSDLPVDFNLDGQIDSFAYLGGPGFMSFKMSAGARRSTESLHDVLIRLGLEQYWIGEKKEDQRVGCRRACTFPREGTVACWHAPYEEAGDKPRPYKTSEWARMAMRAADPRTAVRGHKPCGVLPRPARDGPLICGPYKSNWVPLLSSLVPSP